MALRISFLGLGLMGSPMAGRLLAAGHAVTVWNRNADKAIPLAGQGATIAITAADAVREVDIIFTMLTNGSAVADVLFTQGVAEAAPKGALVIDMSSILPAEAIDHAARLREKGLRFLDAPVSGGTVGAEAGTLAIMVGGDEADFEEAVPLFKVMGRPTHVGPTGAGQYAKLANQVIVGTTIAAVAEGLLLAASGGADPAKVREALRGGFAESRILDLHGGRMISRDFAPRGHTSNQLKDLRNALKAAASTGFEMPVTSLMAELFDDLLAHEGDLDHSALYLGLERRSQK